MDTQESQGQVPKETLYEKLLSLVGTQDKIEQIKSDYPDSKFRKQHQRRISFSKVISSEWIIRTLSNNGIANGEKARFIDLTNEEKMRFIDLRKVCQDEYDIEIYFYFTYFSGILFLFTEEEYKHGLYGLRKFFEDKTEDNRSFLFRFMTTYIDLVDPTKRDIIEYRQLKECLVEDHDNILFDLFDKDLELMMEVLQKTASNWGGYRCDTIKEQIFPGIEDKYISSGGEKNIIRSIIQSGIAKLYFIAGRELEHTERLAMALSFDQGYPYNSFALVQTAHILAQRREKLGEAFDNEKISDEEDDDNIIHKGLLGLIKTADSAVKAKLSRKDPIGTSERLFKKVIDLMNYDLGKGQYNKDGEGQFKAFSPFNYRILLEAIIGLAYIDFLRGHDNEAKQKYKEAQKIIDEHLEDNKEYLTSILSLNSGRNKLDNGSKEDDEEAKSDFRNVIDIYEKASEKSIRKELAEIAARAHNNLGIFYLNEADYDNAEKSFRQSIEIDYNNPYARYNLGILYYKKEEKTRALTLFRNAHYIDPDFSEAKVALDKLDALKKRSLGSDWFSWWFEKETRKKGKIRVPHKRVSIKPIIALLLIGAIATSFGGLAIELSIHHLAGVHAGVHTHESTPYIIMIGISLAILLLPFINKLKVSDIEIELETTGYRPVAPASVSEGIADPYYDALKYRFFFAAFWYPFSI